MSSLKVSGFCSKVYFTIKYPPKAQKSAINDIWKKAGLSILVTSLCPNISNPKAQPANSAASQASTVYNFQLFGFSPFRKASCPLLLQKKYQRNDFYYEHTYFLNYRKSVARLLLKFFFYYTRSISKFSNCTNSPILSSISFLVISFNLMGPNFSTQKLANALPTMIAVFIFSKLMSLVLAK